MRVYFDYNATTPLDPEVVAAIQPHLTPGLAGIFGNPSSSHEYGLRSHAAVAEARAGGMAAPVRVWNAA